MAWWIENRILNPPPKLVKLDTMNGKFMINRCMCCFSPIRFYKTVEFEKIYYYEEIKVFYDINDCYDTSRNKQYNVKCCERPINGILRHVDNISDLTKIKLFVLH